MYGVFTAFQIVGNVLNKTIATFPDFDWNNGTLLANQFFNQTIMTKGGEIYIDEVGERAENYIVEDLNQRTLIFEVWLNERLILVFNFNSFFFDLC